MGFMGTSPEPPAPDPHIEISEFCVESEAVALRLVGSARGLSSRVQLVGSVSGAHLRAAGRIAPRAVKKVPTACTTASVALVRQASEVIDLRSCRLVT